MSRFVPVRTAAVFLAIAAATVPARAEFGTAKSITFRSASDRNAMIQAENMRITAENVYFQQQQLIDALQRGTILNNLIIVNQSGNGTIDLKATQTSSGNSTINNDIVGGIRF